MSISGQTARLAHVSLMALLVAQCTYHAGEHLYPVWAAWATSISTILLLQYVDVGILSGVEYDKTAVLGHKTFTEAAARGSYERNDGMEEEKDAGRSGWTAKPSSRYAGYWTEQVAKLIFGILQMVSFRHVDTDWEVKNVPPFSASDPSYVPSRQNFLPRKLFVLTLCYLVIDGSDTLGKQSSAEETAQIFSASNVPLLMGSRENFSTERLAIRAGATFMFFLNIFVSGHFVYSSLAIASVSSGLSEPRAWRPAFGALSDARSVRLFWGKFWHQVLRRLLSSPATFMAGQILGLRRGSLSYRYAHLFAVFTFSGLFHILPHIAMGMPSTVGMGALRFFVTQACGIAFEDAVVWAYGRLLARLARARAKDANDNAGVVRLLLERSVGYVWTAMFLVWSAPAWAYPVSARQIEGAFLPFSIFGNLI
ncbi:MAG: hypothetical protein M1831_004669 [Alyxoria varia]|nr:MAG: hypothetical protein M1831_000802 [Alyxoria varia]KAI9656098.1 MAG: hypothetical protein M1831_004669 [Alyxoria varia]